MRDGWSGVIVESEAAFRKGPAPQARPGDRKGARSVTGQALPWMSLA